MLRSLYKFLTISLHGTETAILFMFLIYVLNLTLKLFHSFLQIKVLVSVTWAHENGFNSTGVDNPTFVSSFESHK